MKRTNTEWGSMWIRVFIGGLGLEHCTTRHASCAGPPNPKRHYNAAAPQNALAHGGGLGVQRLGSKKVPGTPISLCFGAGRPIFPRHS